MSWPCRLHNKKIFKSWPYDQCVTIGVEKSGKNAQGDSWWETWQEILRQDDWRFYLFLHLCASSQYELMYLSWVALFCVIVTLWMCTMSYSVFDWVDQGCWFFYWSCLRMGGSNLARIEKSAQKQAKSGSGSAGWYEKWYVSIHFFWRRVGCLSLRFLAYRLRATFLVLLESHWHVLVHMWLNSIWTKCRGVIYISDSLLKFSGKFTIRLFGISLYFLPLSSFQYNRESLLGLFGDCRFKFRVVLANKIYLILSLPWYSPWHMIIPWRMS